MIHVCESAALTNSDNEQKQLLNKPKTDGKPDVHVSQLWWMERQSILPEETPEKIVGRTTWQNLDELPRVMHSS